MINIRIFRLVLLLSVIILFGCNKGKSIEEVLVGNGMQFWDVYDNERGFITGSYSFNVNGSCFYYTYKKGVRSKIFEGDLVYQHNWNVQGDTILHMIGFDRRIVRYDSDTLLLKNLKTNEIIVLIRGDN